MVNKRCFVVKFILFDKKPDELTDIWGGVIYAFFVVVDCDNTETFIFLQRI